MPVLQVERLLAETPVGQMLLSPAFGERSPVTTFSETLYAELRLDAGAALQLPSGVAERALYVFDGEVDIDGARFEAGRLLVLEGDRALRFEAATPAHVFLVGGAPLDGPRHLWWNFVSSSTERIERARADWQAGRFAQVPGDDEFIPLPEK